MLAPLVARANGKAFILPYENSLVSIICPTYNRGAHIAEMIESVLAQTYQEWELIIVDDASSDGTAVLVKGYAAADSRIKLLSQPEKSGPAAARNAGIKEARGRFVAFLDSDDIWLAGKLEEQMNFMREKGAAFSFTQYRQFAGEASNCGGLIEIPGRVDYKALLQGNAIACLTVMLDRRFVPEIAMPLGYKNEDYVTWLGILKGGREAYGLQKDLARYRIAGNSMSSNKASSALWVWRIYRHVEKLPFCRALYCFLCYAWKGWKKYRLRPAQGKTRDGSVSNNR